MNIAGNPNVVDIMYHADRYRVDLNTLEIVPRPGVPTEAAVEEFATGTPATDTAEASVSSSTRSATWLLVVTGIAIAGSAALAGALWRSRQS
jgi:hypothetical protein